MQASINRIRRRSIVHSRSRHGDDSGTGSEVVGRPPSLTSSNKRRVMAALMPDVPSFAMLDRPRKGGARTSGRRRSSGEGAGAAGLGLSGSARRWAWGPAAARQTAAAKGPGLSQGRWHGPGLPLGGQRQGRSSAAARWTAVTKGSEAPTAGGRATSGPASPCNPSRKVCRHRCRRRRRRRRRRAGRSRGPEKQGRIRAGTQDTTTISITLYPTLHTRTTTSSFLFTLKVISSSTHSFLSTCSLTTGFLFVRLASPPTR